MRLAHIPFYSPVPRQKEVGKGQSTLTAAVNATSLVQPLESHLPLHFTVDISVCIWSLIWKLLCKWCNEFSSDYNITYSQDITNTACLQKWARTTRGITKDLPLLSIPHQCIHLFTKVYCRQYCKKDIPLNMAHFELNIEENYFPHTRESSCEISSS